MPRIKITGYINTDDLGASEIDLDHPTGLSAEGYDVYTGPDGVFQVSDLEDLEVELED